MKVRLERYYPRIDHLWPLIILAGLGFYTSLVPLPPNDFWWHLKIGELISTTRSIPTTNMFAWTLPADFTFTYGAWLGELLFYLLYRVGRIPLILFVRTLLAIAAFGLVGYEARRRSGSWRLAAPAVAIAGLMSLNNLIVRPQIWSWLPFMIFYILLSRYAAGQLSRKWLLLCPLLMVFWVNVHGAFVLGPVLLGAFFVGEGIRAALRGSGALPWRDVGWLGIITVASVLMTAVNPQFVGIYGYVLDLMTDRPSQGLIVEWQSPTPGGIANTVFFVSILLLLLILAYSRYRPTPTESLLLVGFLWLAWSGQRYVVWFGMVAMPILSQALREMLPSRYLSAPAVRNKLNLVLAVLIWVPVLMVQPWFVEQSPLPQTYWELVLQGVEPGPLLAVETPVGAAEYLRAHPGGHLFNEMGYGSYLIWAIPDQGVFIDPRVELYPYEQWLDYVRIGRGIRYNELLAEYGVDRVLLNIDRQEELSHALAGDVAWNKEYEDQYAQIWIKNSD